MLVDYLCHQHLRSRVRLDHVHHIVYPCAYNVWTLPRGLKRGRFPLHAEWAIEPHFVAFVVACAVVQFLVTNFNLVIGQLQVVADITMDARKTRKYTYKFKI
jgi:hypothetical protein